MVMQIYIINRKIHTHAIRGDLLERVSDQKQLRVTESEVGEDKCECARLGPAKK